MVALESKDDSHFVSLVEEVFALKTGTFSYGKGVARLQVSSPCGRGVHSHTPSAVNVG